MFQRFSISDGIIIIRQCKHTWRGGSVQKMKQNNPVRCAPGGVVLYKELYINHV